VRVIRDGVELSLPPSRKARAVLGYLAASGRPHRRERLCEMFWDVPDDPRGSLRWALSKLRSTIEKGEAKYLAADRERIALDGANISIDFVNIRNRLFDNPIFIPADELRHMADSLSLPFMDGLNNAGKEEFQSWLATEREHAQLMATNVLRRLSLHPEIEPKEAVKWSRLWQKADPYNVGAAKSLIANLTAAGREKEADQFVQCFKKAFEQAGFAVPEFTERETVGQAQASMETGEVKVASPRRMLCQQDIGFCKSEDGVSIAHASVGSGPPLVKAANWLNHLEFDWGSPIWGRTFAAAAKCRTFIRYDERGNGLSDWDVEDISFEAFVRDLETVADALGLEKFPLLGISQGCAVSIEYAVRHPERVSGLVLVSGYAAGWRIGASVEEKEKREAVLTLTKHGWGTSNRAYRHIFSQTFMPDAKPEDLEWFDEFQRQCTSPENAVRFQNAFADIDVRESLAKVDVPTIVFHSHDDQRVSLEQGRELAIGIPNARFVPLESRNHILLDHEPAWETCRDAIAAFLEEHGI
ncbi:MAG: alpha/beta fold hydrolase, partial [Pseudomonadota bacterium]